MGHGALCGFRHVDHFSRNSPLRVALLKTTANLWRELLRPAYSGRVTARRAGEWRGAARRYWTGQLAGSPKAAAACTGQ